jgi:hypothetical protein
MSNGQDNQPFYIGYLPKAPAGMVAFTRKTIAVIGGGALALAAGAALTLPYFGGGEFEFGQPREFTGTVRCEVAPRLVATDTDYLLVGFGKNGVAPEICGAAGSEVTLRGTLIQREGRQLLEVTSAAAVRLPSGVETPPVPLGRFTLRGEIVDSKCYFGVMNPAEGPVHRACAELCLRGGVPAVFVARDRAGAVAHLLIADRGGNPLNAKLLSYAGEQVELSGNVSRLGRWLVLHPDLASLRSEGRTAPR